MHSLLDEAKTHPMVHPRNIQPTHELTTSATALLARRTATGSSFFRMFAALYKQHRNESQNRTLLQVHANVLSVCFEA